MPVNVQGSVLYSRLQGKAHEQQDRAVKVLHGPQSGQEEKAGQLVDPTLTCPRQLHSSNSLDINIKKGFTSSKHLYKKVKQEVKASYHRR